MPDIISFLKNYDGDPVTIMEVCGSHTAAIEKNGIRSMLGENVNLISGPGCPVCVTVTEYIDRLIELSLDEKNVIVTFGDLIRVPGSSQSLYEAKALGADVRMVYSPLDTLKLAAEDGGHDYIFAAVGFETTAPVYAVLIKNAIEAGINNLRLLTSLKTMPPVVEWVCENSGVIDGFLAPGHVCAVTGYGSFEGIAERYGLPFVAAGFDGPQILTALYALIKMKGRGVVKNVYTNVVTREGNIEAQRAISEVFERGDASWRGMGRIPGSALYLREEFSSFDAGSAGLNEDRENKGCHCARILTGKEKSSDCPLFGTACTPLSPKGACMVSQEGACFNSVGEKLHL
ncbi:MAG: hydrogenase formation protein HypD [Lachnospiraceae bacterium]|nr:hydrogenase formation protein HypD [Lachnospiraceae bacterium]